MIHLISQHVYELVQAFRCMPEPKKAIVGWPVLKVFFRPTPIGFRQVVHHVQVHVA